VIVSTDSEDIAEAAARYGAEVPGLRPAEIASSTSPDIEWVRHVLGGLATEHREPELFSILRPTSPFRGADTIRRAHDELLSRAEADSIRAVERCKQHPGKMWTLDGELMRPLLPQSEEGVPTHSRQYQDLPEVFVQNSSLEIAWTRTVTEQGSIAGDTVAPFFTDGAEGFTIDYEGDWFEAERMLAEGEATLPSVDLGAAAKV
jgi:CMP-N-acetylneuraminic acid synthetase